jgi:hypothetical protein
MARSSWAMVAVAFMRKGLCRTEKYASTKQYTPYSPYLNYWTRPNPLRSLLRTTRSRNTDRYLRRIFMISPSVSVCVLFECLSAVAMKRPFISDVTLYRPVEVHECFGGMHCLHFRVEE